MDQGGGLSNTENKVIVVKVGGATLGSHDTTIEDIAHLQKQGKSLVIVHGGGPLITEWLNKQGLSSCFIQGERVTDQGILDVVVAVLAGLVNKEIVAAINNRGGLAVGLSGVDGAIIQGSIKDTNLGYVGTIVKVNLTLLRVLLQSGYIPVMAPVSLLASDKSEGTPQIVNINADDVAGEIAATISAEKLIFLTDVAGISDQSGRLLPRLSPGEAEALVASGVAAGGMIPKIRACLRALSVATTAEIIDGRQPHALLKVLEGHIGGTTIKAG
ncbi:acetylglutamate kinase [Chloroflexota bacterium]